VRRTTSIVAAGPLLPAVAGASLGAQATPEILPHHPAVTTAATLAPRRSRRQRGQTPAVARRARVTAGPATSVTTQRSGLMIHWRLSRAVTVAAATAAAGLAAVLATGLGGRPGGNQDCRRNTGGVVDREDDVLLTPN
jgi:hypothetical protein